MSPAARLACGSWFAPCEDPAKPIEGRDGGGVAWSLRIRYSIAGPAQDFRRAVHGPLSQEETAHGARNPDSPAWRPRGHDLGGDRGRRARRGPGTPEASRYRTQLHRHLSPLG